MCAHPRRTTPDCWEQGMVAIFTGEGLGLQSSSALGLGGRGQIGNAALGKTGEEVYVNAATGNLVLRDQDELLLGQGVAGAIFRAYNSQGQTGEDWRPGSARSVDGLTGVLNTAGSTVTRTDWDGTRIVYQYDTTRGLYVATSGAGVRPTLAFDGGSNAWTWTDDGSQLRETYDALQGGRIVASTDRDGNAVSYAYNAAGLLSGVTTASGDTVTLEYNGALQLTDLKTVTQNAGGPATSTTVRYAYDAQGRLGQVIVDLSPDDNSVADGKVFTTTYGYDGTSDRIASIDQSDGSRVSFTYADAGDGTYRVTSFSQLSDTGVLRTTTLTYGNGTTTITDPLGQITQLDYDSVGRLTRITSPTVGGRNQVQNFRYDTNGQVSKVTDALGRSVVYTYDSHGNLVEQVDSAGNVVDRTYGAHDELLVEWTYTTAVNTDPVTGDPVKVAGAATTTQSTMRYAYDSELHVRFAVTAQGRVTEYRYNAAGQQVSVIQYTGFSFGTAPSLAQNPVTESLMTAVLTSSVPTQAERTDTTYDLRGNVAQITSYAQLLGDGTGYTQAAAGEISTTRYVYDAFGCLLQRFVGANAGTQVEQDTYDGLGRLLSTTRADGSATLYQYDDAHQQIVVTFASGLVRTSTYDRAGELIAVADAQAGTILSQTHYVYDADGQLRMTADGLGRKQFYLYDAMGRRTGDVSAEGALTEYVYDDGDRLTQTIAYATRLSATTLTGLVDAQGQPLPLDLTAALRPAASAMDHRTWRFYDASSRLVQTVDATGAVVDYTYDGSGELVATDAHATRIDPVAFAAKLVATVAAPATSANDRVTRYFYDKDGLLLGQLDGEGYLTTYRYNTAGQKLESVTYATATNASLRATGDLNSLTPMFSASDVHHSYQYDSRGLLRNEIDGEGYVTSYNYDAFGNVAQRIRGKQADDSLLGGNLFAQITFQATTNLPTGTVVRVAIDGSFGGSSVTIANGSGTYSAYVTLDPTISHSVQFIFADQAARTSTVIDSASIGNYTFDMMGSASQVGSAAGKTNNVAVGVIDSVAFLRDWAATASQAEITNYQYDAEGRLLGVTEVAGSTVDSTTSYTYDSDGRVTSQTQDGRTTTYRYDAQGHLVAQLNGEGSAALASLGSSPSNEQVESVWSQWAVHYTYDAAGQRTAMTDADGVRTLFYYDANGQLSHTVDATGAVIAYQYDAFGNTTQTTVYASRVAAGTLGSLIGGELTDELRATFDALGADGQASVTSIGYDAAGRAQLRTNARGFTTGYAYDAFGDLVASSQQIDAQQQAQTTYGYDHLGQQTAVTRDSGGLNLLSQAIYDAFGRVMESVDANGVHRTRQYDRNGNVIVITDGNGGQAQMTYDAYANVLTRTDANGNTTRYAYDFATHEVTVTTAEGIVTRSTSNTFGQIVAVTDGNGHTTTYTYDLDGHLVSTTGPAGTTSATYDQGGRLFDSTDANGTRTSFGYDAAGRLLTRTFDPNGLHLVTTYAYDAKGQTVRVTDPSGSVTDTVYDKDGQIVHVIADPDGLKLTTTFVYDGAGRTVRTIEGDGSALPRTTERHYDGADRLISTVIDPDGLAITTGYTYDANGNVVTVTDANGGLTRNVYDTENRLSYTVDATGAVTHTTYDADGNVVARTRYATRIDLTGLGAVVGSADVTARLSVNAADRVDSYAYDKDGRLRYTLDGAGRLTGMSYDANGNLTQKVSFATTYQFDQFTVASVSSVVSIQSVDRVTTYIYDAANRLVFTIDPAGAVVENRYDANGNRLATVAYEQDYTVAGTPALATMQSWATTHVTAGTRLSQWFYDSANRPAYCVDAEGYATGYTYDAAGRLTATERFDARLSGVTASDTVASIAARLTSATGSTTRQQYDAAGRVTDAINAAGVITHYVLDGMGQATAITVAYGTAQAVTTLHHFDAVGRLVEETRADGTTVASTTRYVYDALGQRTQVIDPRGVALVSQDSTALRDQRKALGIVDTAGNGKDVTALTAADIAKLLSYYTTTTTYDAAGNPIQTRSPFGALSAAGPVYATVATVYDADGHAIKVTDARGHSGYFYYDAAGRVTLQVDPAGYVTTTDYDTAGNATRVVHYSVALSGPIDEHTRPALPSAAGSATTAMTYDSLGHLTQVTDAQGGIEQYSYDAFGNRTQVINKLGGISTFTYDHLGHVTGETMPVTTTASGGASIAVSNSYTYDARGNRIGSIEAVGAAEQRSTTFTYDAMDRLTATIHAPVTTYVNGVGVRTVSPAETRSYDLRGNLVTSTDANGNVTTSYYDAANHVIAQVGPTGAYTSYAYDAAGNQVDLKAYDTLLSLPVNPAVPPGLVAGAVRETQSTYDAANRLIATRQPNVSVAQAIPGASANGQYTALVTTVTRTWTYDAGGLLVANTDGNGHVSRTWYDTVGKAVLSIDAEGYGVAWTRDQDGNVLKETRFATKYAGDPSTIADAGAAVAAWPHSADDRITDSTYDLNGRVLSQTLHGVAYGSVDSVGHLTEQTGDAVTSYAYDAAGNLLRRTDANGSLFGWSYDLSGRTLSASSPAFTDYAGRTVQTRTEYVYDAFNNVIRETRKGATAADDQVNVYAYDVAGHLATKTNALGITTQMQYDAVGNLTRMSYTLTDAEGAAHAESTDVRYDAANREVWRDTQRDGTAGVERRTRYNAYGDVTGRGTGATGWQESSDYDSAGHMVRSNADGGITRIYLYDGNGNATIAIESQTTDLNTVSVATSTGAADLTSIFAAANVTWTLTEYDGRNQVVDVIQPSMDINGAHLSLTPYQQSGNGPGQIGVTVGGPVGPASEQPAIDPANAITARPGGLAVGAVTATPSWGQTGGLLAPPSKYLLQVSVPDFSSVFGAYSLRVVVKGNTSGSLQYVATTPPYTFSNIPVTTGAWTKNGSNTYIVSLSYSVEIYVTPRETGVEQMVGQSTSSTLTVHYVQQTATQGIVQGVPASVSFSPVVGSPKIKLSAQDSSQFTAGTLKAQVYIRPWGPAGPYTLATIVPGSPSTIDISNLAAGGTYEVLYIAEHADGTPARTEQYQLIAGANPSISGAFYGAQPAFQTFGGGSFVMSSNALVASDMRTANGTRPAWASFAYRPRGSNAAWVWAAGGGATIVNGTSSMSLNGIPAGDYDINLWMFDGNNNGIQMLEGRMVISGTPSIQLNYPRPPDNAITFSNLPTTAKTISFKLVSQRDGTTVNVGPLAITTPGSFAWNIAQSVFDASGASCNWTVTATMTDANIIPPTTYNATGTITVGTARPLTSFPVTVQGNVYTLAFDPRDTNNQPITAGNYLVLRYWADAHPDQIQRVIIAKGSDGKYQWDSLGLDPNTAYSYYYDVFATQAQATGANGNPGLVRNNGHFTPHNGPSSTETHWVIGNIQDNDVTVHRSQTHDAFGDVVTEKDGRGNTTTLKYNTQGSLVAKIDPNVTVTLANGFQTLVSPQTTYSYDRTGHQVAQRDANGNLSTQSWNDALGKVAMEYHADGGVTSYQYDAMGDQRVRVQALDVYSLGAPTARRTDYTYDKGDRLVRVDGPAVNGQRPYDIYTYDERDRRLTHATVLGTDTVDYDVEGNVSAVVSAAGRKTTYTTVWDGTLNGGKGAWVQTTTLPYNMASTYAEDHVVRTLVDQRDSSGRALRHIDTGGRITDFLYYQNGLLKQQGTTAYTYYSNGLMRTMTDSSNGTRGSYEYDNNGNLTFEGFTGQSGQWAFQQSVSTYDALNRLTKVTDPRYTIDYEYDAMGNRIHMKSVYTDGLGTPGQVQDYWYGYDTMNRFTTTMGTINHRGTSAADSSAVVSMGTGGQGVAIGYDAFSERVSATYASDGHHENYQYDALGYLTVTTITGANNVRTGKTVRINDLAGRVGEYDEYGVTDSTVVQSITHTWDADSLLLEDHDNKASNTNGYSTGTRTERLADGTVKATQTYGGPTTVRTTYDYVWFDSAKQSRIQVQASNQSAPGWQPGLSSFQYDAEGRLVAAYDVAGNRGFSYQLDGEGHILQRDELINGTYNPTTNTVVNASSNRSHSYYFMDGEQIGNVGNDGPEYIDYAQELAQHEAQSSNRDDQHKRFTPVAFADFDSNYQPINSEYPSDAPGSYIVHSGDTLPAIAQSLWGDSSLWWMLADANNLTLDSPLPPNSVLTVPNKVTNIHNNNTTFRPYDAGKAIGNTQPTLPDAPPPPAPHGAGGGGCGGALQIIAIVAAVVVTIYTAGAAAGLLSVAAGSAGAGTFATGLAVLGGTAVGSTAAIIGAAAIGGAVGSLVSQGVLIAGGAQSGLNWKGVAMGAIGAGVTSGLSTLTVGGQSLGQAINAGVGGGFRGAVAEGTVSATATSAIGSITGAQSFDWKGIAASAVASGAGYGATKATSSWSTAASRTASGLAGGVASAAVRGNLSQSWAGIAEDAIGSTVGNAISDQIAKNSIPSTQTTLAKPSVFLDNPSMEVGGGTGTIQAPAQTYAGSVAAAVTATTSRASDGIPTLSPVVVTPNDRFNEDYLNLWEWSNTYHRDPPPQTTSQAVLDSYRSQQYASTAPAYAAWERKTNEALGIHMSQPRVPEYVDIGNWIDSKVAVADHWLASLQAGVHDGNDSINTWMSEATSPGNAALRASGYAVGKLGNALLDSAIGGVRFFTNPAVHEAIGDAVGKPGPTASKVWEGIKAMPTEDKLLAVVQVLMAGGPGAAEKLDGLLASRVVDRTVSEAYAAVNPVLNTKVVDAGIIWGRGIQGQGMPWEDYLAGQLPAGSRLPANFKTFDFYDIDTGNAISAKTLNTTTASRVADPSKIYYSLKGNVDAIVNFDKPYTLSGTTLDPALITSRELRVAVPVETTPAQWQHINRAIQYGQDNGVKVIVTPAH